MNSATPQPPEGWPTYYVEADDAVERRALPVVIGVLADLSGQAAKPPVPLRERRFIAVDEETLNALMASVKPRVAFKAANVLTTEPDPDPLRVELYFSRMEDLDPINVARQFQPLRKLLEVRESLVNLRSALQGNDSLDELLQRVVTNPRRLAELSREIAVWRGSDD
jgi:type VI secretion system protein ImpB